MADNQTVLDLHCGLNPHMLKLSANFNKKKINEFISLLKNSGKNKYETTIRYWSTKRFEAWLYLQYRCVVLEKRVSGIYLYLF